MSHITPSLREIAEVAAQGDVVNMTLGVVHALPPQSFRDAITKLVSEQRLHTYTPAAGYMPYRETLLEILKQQGADLTLEQIMATSGVTGGLVSALRSRCEPDDKVLLLEPFYPAHDLAIRAIHAETEYVPYDADFRLNWFAIEEALPRVRAVLIANPANPTGALLNKEDLHRLHEACRSHDVLLVMDEVYKDFIWEGKFYSLLEDVDDFEHLVVTRSFSKNLALAGWRVGYAIASPERLLRMIQAHEGLCVGGPAPAQVVLASLLKDPGAGLAEFLNELTALYKNNRLAMIEAFTAYGMEPRPKGGAYYMMVKHNRDSDILAMKELLERGVAVAPGVPFYRPGTKDTGYLRVHFALSLEDRGRVQELLSF